MQNQYAKPVDNNPQMKSFTFSNCLLTTLLLAMISAGVAYLGLAISRVIMDTPLYESTGNGALFNISSTKYAVTAAIIGALASLFLFMLISFRFPATSQLFGALLFIGTALATIVPLTTDHGTSWKIAIALTNFLIGITISIVLIQVSHRYAVDSPDRTYA